jgi:hypothetical protein
VDDPIIESSDYIDETDSDDRSYSLPTNEKKKKDNSPLSYQQFSQQQVDLETEQEDQRPPPSDKGKNLHPIANASNGNNVTVASLLSVSSSSSAQEEFDNSQPKTSNDGRVKQKLFKFCFVCDYSITDYKSNLSCHNCLMNMHTDERPFKCIECSKTFKNSGALYYHRFTHLSPEFKCDYCPKMFIRKQDRNRHMNIHTGARPYKCDVCHKKFNDPSTLRHHRQSHSAPKYECPFCHKMFAQSRYWKLHWNGNKYGDIVCPVRRQQIADKSN